MVSLGILANHQPLPPILIRPAVFFDIPMLIDLGRRMHRLSAYSFLSFDAEKVETMLRHFLNTPMERCLFVAEDDGLVVGGLAGYLTEYFFSHDKLARDQTFFMAPERRGLAAIQLIRAFCDWAQTRGARQVSLTTSSGIAIERSGTMIERLGFTRVGGNYKMRLG